MYGCGASLSRSVFRCSLDDWLKEITTTQALALCHCRPFHVAQSALSGRRAVFPTISIYYSFKGFGHNASPVREESVACETCNGAIVPRFRKWSA